MTPDTHPILTVARSDPDPHAHPHRPPVIRVIVLSTGPSTSPWCPQDTTYTTRFEYSDGRPDTIETFCLSADEPPFRLQDYLASQTGEPWEWDPGHHVLTPRPHHRTPVNTPPVSWAHDQH